MNYEKVLNKLETNEITPSLAYDELYPIKKTKPGKRAFFIKLRIHVPEEGKKVNAFLKILFALPIPLVFARLGLRLAGKYADIEEDVDLNEIARLLKYSKHTKISVDTEDAKIDIKII
jgi:hypothetical protein